MNVTRRSFLKARGAVCAIGALHAPAELTFPAMGPGDVAKGSQPETRQILDTGWEYYQGPLDPRHQIWHSKELVVWQPVTVPHCFNHYDACDPDTPA